MLDKILLVSSWILAKSYLLFKSKWLYINKMNLVYILKYARKNSSYYKEIIPKCRITQSNVYNILEELPLLSKDIIREKDIFNKRINEGWSKWANTGGSTGEPLRFPLISSLIPYELICQMLIFMKMGYKIGDRIISIDGSRLSETNINKKHFYKFTDHSFPYGRHHFSVLYLEEDTFKYYITSINQIKPHFLRGYPSAIKKFCELLKNSSYCLEFELKGCYLTSENFSNEDKEFIFDVLKCPIFGQYGHTEASVFAIQNHKSEEYICSLLYGYTEVLNESNQHVQVGEQGEIYVTGFTHLGLPFIRYKTGDLAIYGGKTIWGETILSRLIGRDSDYIYNLNKEKVYLVGFIFGGHLHAFDYMKEWQIVQNKIGYINLYIVRDKLYNDNIENEIVELFRKNLFEVSVYYVENIEKTVRGKRKFLIRNID